MKTIRIDGYHFNAISRPHFTLAELVFRSEEFGQSLPIEKQIHRLAHMYEGLVTSLVNKGVLSAPDLVEVLEMVVQFKDEVVILGENDEELERAT